MTTIKLFIFILIASIPLALSNAALTRGTAPSAKRKAAPARTAAKSASKKPAARKPASKKPAARSSSPWKEPSFADSTLGDTIDGEDLAVRQAAVRALGAYNGSVVVTDAANGRVLTIVNQKLALKSGFQPCSTIKIVTALAALREGVIERSAPFDLTRRSEALLTAAMARSSNWYFANLGQKLGFQRVREYASLFGLGEKAALNLPGEQPGILPSAPPKSGGVGMMTSFGSGIAQTPLGLAALLSAIANGGTLYWLQYPRTQAEAAQLAPVVKRKLEIGGWLDEVKTAMRAVVDRGTGRRAATVPGQEILGKTGTCTDSRSPTHMGWFGSFAEVGERKLAVVVMLTGGRAVSGPVAAGIAGNVYRNLQSALSAAGGPRTYSCCG